MYFLLNTKYFMAVCSNIAQSLSLSTVWVHGMRVVIAQLIPHSYIILIAHIDDTDIALGYRINVPQQGCAFLIILILTY